MEQSAAVVPFEVQSSPGILPSPIGLTVQVSFGLENMGVPRARAK